MDTAGAPSSDTPPGPASGSPSARTWPRSATTRATATRSVWDSERCHRTTPARFARASAAADRTRYGRVQTVPSHLHIVEGVGPEADPHGLHHCLLGREPGGQSGYGIRGRPGVGELGFGEQPVGHRGPSLEHPGEPGQIHCVDAHPHHSGRRPVPVHQLVGQAPRQRRHRRGTVPSGHSTVTTLARLRGRSTSRPCSLARW